MDLIPIEMLNEQGIIAIIFTVVAAIASVMTDRKKKTENASGDIRSHQLIDRAFNQMEKNIDALRIQNLELKGSLKKSLSKSEEYRDRYHKQIEINNFQSAQLTKLNLEFFYKNDKGLDNSE
jgi:hypothetical protein